MGTQTNTGGTPNSVLDLLAMGYLSTTALSHKIGLGCNLPTSFIIDTLGVAPSVRAPSKSGFYWAPEKVAEVRLALVNHLLKQGDASIRSETVFEGVKINFSHDVEIEAQVLYTALNRLYEPPMSLIPKNSHPRFWDSLNSTNSSSRRAVVAAVMEAVTTARKQALDVAATVAQNCGYPGRGGTLIQCDKSAADAIRFLNQSFTGGLEDAERTEH